MSESLGAIMSESFLKDATVVRSLSNMCDAVIVCLFVFLFFLRLKRFITSFKIKVPLYMNGVHTAGLTVCPLQQGKNELWMQSILNRTISIYRNRSHIFINIPATL
jgi:hypothetical protein